MGYSYNEPHPIVRKNLNGIILKNTKEMNDFLYDDLGIHGTFMFEDHKDGFIEIKSYKDEENYTEDLVHYHYHRDKKIIEQGFYFNQRKEKVKINKKIITLKELKDIVKNNLYEVCALDYNRAKKKSNFNKEDFFKKIKLKENKIKYSQDTLSFGI